MSYPLTPEITIPLTQKLLNIETSKKCPEVPASYPDFDDISIFSTVTTDLPENHCFLKILFYGEKKIFSGSF